MAKRYTIVVPDWAVSDVEKFMAAQGNKGVTFALLIGDAMRKYGVVDYLSVKFSEAVKTPGSSDAEADMGGDMNV